MKVKLVMIVVGLAMLVFFGCAKAPQHDVEAAKTALEIAKAAEVDRYAADQYMAAHDSLKSALTEIETQNSKSIFTKNYKKATSLLAFTINSLNGVLDEIDSTKALVKANAESLLVNAQTEFDETQAMMQNAPKTKQVRAELESIQSELSACETALLEVSGNLEKGDFISAQDQVQTTAEQIGNLKNQVEHIISKQVTKKAR